ncbi:MAG: 4Fe-4S binding protein [Hyphomicrobiales bacterium]|nr:MAG: 4Fe-4S binding protein [Hyphomicrobiales bacterium]
MSELKFLTPRFLSLARLLFFISILATNGFAASVGEFQKFLTQTPASVIFEGAEAYGALQQDGKIAPIQKNGQDIGYAFLNTDFVGAIGYSGKPIVVLIAIDLQGKITGAKLLKHSEPIVLTGIPEAKITNFINGYKGIDIIKMAKEKGGEPPPVDIVSGATVTIMVIDDSIKRASLRAATALGLNGLAQSNAVKAKRTIIESELEELDWTSMIGDGSVRRLKLTIADVNQGFVEQGNKQAIARPEKAADEDIFIDLYAASLNVPSIAKSLLGKWEYRNYLKRIEQGQSAFMVMGTGLYSFRGSGYVRGGIFDRIQVVQDGEGMRFTDHGYKNLGEVLAEGSPDFREVALFYAPGDAIFNPADSWQLQLLVQRAVGPLEKVFISYELNYQLPSQYIKVEQPPTPATSVQVQTIDEEEAAARTALWQRLWVAKKVDVIILGVALVFLTLLFFVQDQMVKYRGLTDWIRWGFLAFTLFYIGFYLQAQLSVVNVLVFINAMLSNFRWEFFLMEPMIFILWCSVAVALIFWGRGVYCGWLCPFGALQEFLNKIARLLKIPQVKIPWWLHERLWPLKYIIFLGLLGMSFYSMNTAEHLAEIEPFKTVIILKMMREWWFVLFALALLFISLFVERFYCRYMCPLGAAMAIPGKISMFNWLKRYRNCGDPCHVCATDCMVQAIDPLGNINPNECIHCMGCQQNYHDHKVCPVIIHQDARLRKRAKQAGKPITNLSASDDAVKPKKTRLNIPRRLNQDREIDSSETE